MFFAGFDLLFSILFPILFLVVLGMILYTIIGNIRTCLDKFIVSLIIS